MRMIQVSTEVQIRRGVRATVVKEISKDDIYRE